MQITTCVQHLRSALSILDQMGDGGSEAACHISAALDAIGERRAPPFDQSRTSELIDKLWPDPS